MVLINTNENFNELFRLIDRMELGSIRPDDLFKFLRKHKPDISESEILAIFRRVNSSGSGKIEYPEFVDFMSYSGVVNSSKTKTDRTPAKRKFKQNVMTPRSKSRPRYNNVMRSGSSRGTRGRSHSKRKSARSHKSGKSAKIRRDLSRHSRRHNSIRSQRSFIKTLKSRSVKSKGSRKSRESSIKHTPIDKTWN